VDDEVESLVTLMMLAGADSSAEKFAEALHRVVIQTPDVCSAFNRAVDRKLAADLRQRGLKPARLQSLMTKNRFGAN